MIEPLDIIREDYLTNLKIDGYYSVFNKELIYLNSADITLCQLPQLLYRRAHKIMRKRRRKKVKNAKMNEDGMWEINLE